MLRNIAAAPLLLLAGCAASTHPTAPAPSGRPWSSAALEAVIDQPGPVEVETVVSADWQVSRAGLINLDHPTARAAGLIDGDEPIQVFVHVLRHPTRGLFLVDSGLTRKLVEDPAHAGVGWLVRRYMHPETIKIRTDTAALLARLERPVAGVFLTHLHIDHIGGMPDVPPGTPLFAGPGETADRAFLNAFARGSTDGLLAGRRPIQEWPFQPDPSGRFAGVLDVFGDGSVVALWVPGHTSGSTSYVVRTPHGPVLLTGDACHTRWGWDHDVEPGKFSFDRPRSAVSLAALRALVARHPGIDVRLGHQSSSPAPVAHHREDDVRP
jgi:N-acyl homoserine lactone hydrolase